LETFFVVFFLLLAVGLGLALADRVLMNLAERKASEYASEPFGHPPLVRVHGTVFLTQAFRGRYRRIEVSGGGLKVGDMGGATLDAQLFDADLKPLDLVFGRTRQLPCARVEGRMVLPYGEVARVTHIPALSLNYSSGQLVASAALPIPGVNQIAKVSGHAEINVVEGVVWLRVRGISVAGFSLLPSVVVKQLMPLLHVPIPVPVRLPYGLKLQHLTPTPTGLEIVGAANDVVLKPPS
jgi:hypothetical protein